MDLTERQKTILNLVVGGYTASATPVGSEALAGQPELEVSPATVRHEMATLEALGYLTHPYTSAGRIPTQRGYRYFVEHLMGEEDLSPGEKRTIRHQFHQSPLDLEEWLRLSSAVLAHISQNAALATIPSARRPRLKRLELVSLDEGGVLLVVLLRDGRVKQEVLLPAATISTGELRRFAEELTGQLAGLDAAGLEDKISALEGFRRELVEKALAVLRDLARPSATEFYYYGLANILHQPEFAVTERMERILSLMEGGGVLEAVISYLDLPLGGVQILVGGEERWPEIRDYSLVLAPYQGLGGAMGTLGVLGPVRMPYERSVSAVRYVSGILSDLLSSEYGRVLLSTGT